MDFQNTKASQKKLTMCICVWRVGASFGRYEEVDRMRCILYVKLILCLREYARSLHIFMQTNRPIVRLAVKPNLETLLQRIGMDESSIFSFLLSFLSSAKLSFYSSILRMLSLMPYSHGF